MTRTSAALLSALVLAATAAALGQIELGCVATDAALRKQLGSWRDDSSLYWFAANESLYSQSQWVEISVRHGDGDKHSEQQGVLGLLLYALDEDGRRVGRFRPAAGLRTKTCDLANGDGTLESMDDSIKPLPIKVLWESPGGDVGTVSVVGAVVDMVGSSVGTEKKLRWQLIKAMHLPSMLRGQSAPVAAAGTAAQRQKPAVHGGGTGGPPDEKENSVGLIVGLTVGGVFSAVLLICSGVVLVKILESKLTMRIKQQRKDVQIEATRHAGERPPSSYILPFHGVKEPRKEVGIVSPVDPRPSTARPPSPGAGRQAYYLGTVCGSGQPAPPPLPLKRVPTVPRGGGGVAEAMRAHKNCELGDSGTATTLHLSEEADGVTPTALSEASGVGRIDDADEESSAPSVDTADADALNSQPVAAGRQEGRRRREVRWSDDEFRCSDAAEEATAHPPDQSSTTTVNGHSPCGTAVLY